MGGYMSKYYSAKAYNDTRPGREWLFTITQDRPCLGKDFIDNAIRGAFFEMCQQGVDCKFASIDIGVAENEWGDNMTTLFKIYMDTVDSYYSSEINVDVTYIYHGVHLIRTMNIGK